MLKSTTDKEGSMKKKKRNYVHCRVCYYNFWTIEEDSDIILCGLCKSKGFEVIDGVIIDTNKMKSEELKPTID